MNTTASSAEPFPQPVSQTLEFRATLENVDYNKLTADRQLCEGTQHLVVAELASKTKLRKDLIEIRLHRVSDPQKYRGAYNVQVEARLPFFSVGYVAGIRAAMESVRPVLLEKIVAQPRFDLLKIDRSMPFALSPFAFSNPAARETLKDEPWGRGSDIPRVVGRF
jgi:hypothetical protein